MILGWTIAILIILGQFYLSRRANAYWGIIIPIAYVIYFGWTFINTSEKVNSFSEVLAVVVGLVFLFSIWINGRESVKSKRKKELDKIELHNI
ncbi:hypothetical protein [Alkalihalobacillus sp. R86527]|uniref:hypothetical protein n=1 Tax=Alkalihalobacillus sp. R86527 TaxID=3093863 RepID=UPI00366D0C3A